MHYFYRNFIWVFIFSVLPVFAVETNTTSDSFDSNSSSLGIPASKLLDEFQSTLDYGGQAVDYLVRPIDISLSGDSESIPGNKTLVSIGTTSNFFRLTPFRQDYDFNLNIVLARTQSKLQLFADNLNQQFADNLNQQINNSQNSGFETTESSSSTSESSESSVGISSIIPYKDIFAFNFRAGWLVSIDSLDFFINTGLSTKQDIGNSWQYRFKHNYSIYDSVGASTTTKQFFDKSLNSFLRFQSQTSVFWREETTHITANQVFNLFQRHSSLRSFTYSTGISWLDDRDGEGLQHNVYFYQVYMHKKIYSDWLFLSTTIGVNYSRNLDFRENHFLKVRLEAFSAK